MANTYTGTATISNQTGITNLVQTAYDKYVEFALRAEPMFRAFADKRPVNVDKPGSSIVLQRYADLSTATSALTENVDPDAVALSNTTTVTVTLNEYGNAVLTTEKLDSFSLSDVDPAVANIVAFNMRDSLDVLAQTTLRGGTNTVREISGNLNTGGAVGSITSTDKIQSRDVRYVVSKLRANAAVPFEGGYFTGLIHPDQSLDLRQETGMAAWRDVHVYSGSTSIWNGEIGVYEGVRFIETPRAYQANDGATSGKVSRAYIFGRQALAEAVSREPQVVIGPVTDKLMRHRPLGWKALLGWAIYRQEALYRIETQTSY